MVLSQFEIVVLLCVSAFNADGEPIALGEVIDIDNEKGEGEFFDFDVFEAGVVDVDDFAGTFHFYVVVDLHEVVDVPEVLVVCGD